MKRIIDLKKPNLIADSNTQPDTISPQPPQRLLQLPSKPSHLLSIRMKRCLTRNQPLNPRLLSPHPMRPSDLRNGYNLNGRPLLPNNTILPLQNPSSIPMPLNLALTQRHISVRLRIQTKRR